MSFSAAEVKAGCCNPLWTFTYFLPSLPPAHSRGDSLIRYDTMTTTTMLPVQPHDATQK